jgi:pimeloyl-ACP methyl ester carboxylesterase
MHVERAILVGHSYGCGVVLRAALRHPERVAGIVLVSPFALDEQVGSYFHWAQVPGLGEAMFAAQFRDFPGEKYQLAFGPESRAKFVSVPALDEVERIQARPGTTYAALATIRGMDYAKVENDYAKIDVPLTVVWGEKDRVTPIKMLDTLAARLPKAKFVRVPAVGHMPVWENPAAVLDAFANVDVAVAKSKGAAQ